MQSQITTLQNGLRVISSTRPEIETVSIGIWINTGSRYESEKINGISHFLEHMVFKGTKSRDSLKISEDIENKGGHMNAYTSREFTAFYARMLKDDAELALDVLSELLTSPKFINEELIKEREVVVQEIKQAIDTPDDVIFDYLQEQAFPNQSIGRPIAGTENHVRSFDENTLRNYMQTNYSAENMVVCAVGNIEHEELVAMVEKRLSTIQKKKNFEKEKQVYRGGFFVEQRDIEQVHVTLGFEGIAYGSELYYPAVIFTTIFGGGMSSRLFREIREKSGLVYTVYSFTNAHTQNGLFGIYAGTTNNQLRELVSKVAIEINKVIKDKVLQEELDRAKTQLKASLLMNLESTSSTSEVMARQLLLFDRTIPTEETVEKIEKVTLEDVQNVARKIFSSKPSYVLVGSVTDYPDYEELQELLNG